MPRASVVKADIFPRSPFGMPCATAAGLVAAIGVQIVSPIRPTNRTAFFSIAEGQREGRRAEWSVILYRSSSTESETHNIPYCFLHTAGSAIAMALVSSWSSLSAWESHFRSGLEALYESAQSGQISASPPAMAGDGRLN
ncbi:hypothetical protein CMUS01_07116 [Colletotrichum musicola]|uniref:Uncharacterized protein n=1 Tax=Colletotrichum musicola TaxID=2175873 RepID=A0A8H6KI64_9PEZI|nr:hypothetical protein CMUS01_07116 [Colletotrichum musicola]